MSCACVCPYLLSHYRLRGGLPVFKFKKLAVSLTKPPGHTHQLVLRMGIYTLTAMLLAVRSRRHVQKLTCGLPVQRIVEAFKLWKDE